jgi:hypothetical protein
MHAAVTREIHGLAITEHESRFRSTTRGGMASGSGRKMLARCRSRL